MTDAYSVQSRVRRRTTGELGLIVSANGDFLDVLFATSGQARIHIEDLEPAPSDAVGQLREGLLGLHPEYALRQQARYLQHAYRYDPLTGLSNARIEPKHHQVYVAYRVNRKLRPRMILADEVGLGKTIEAGLIIKEQIARGLAERILVVCPASLQYQWQFELQGKFNEEFTIVDGPTARLFERDGSNPWTKADRIITSGSLARREERAQQIIEAPWDMVIFDEAHHVRRRREGPAKWRTTQLYRLADELKELTEGLLLLTATPMQLDPSELFSLIELVEPGLFPTYESYDLSRRTLPQLNGLMRDLQSWETLSGEKQAEAFVTHDAVIEDLGIDDVGQLNSPAVRDELMDELIAKHPLTLTLVRNRKSVVGGFTSRSPHRILVQQSPEEFDIHAEVSRYIAVGYNRAKVDKNNAVGFLMVLYHKMLTSSSSALRSSFQTRVAKLQQQLENADAFASGDLTDEELLDLAGEEELESAIEELESLATNREEAQWEIGVLEDLIKKLGKVRDSKAEKLIYGIVDPLLKDHPEEKVLIFTGFIKTQEFLAYAFESAGFKVATFNGKMTLEQKEDAVRNFRRSAQIMITTEAGGEGRNFQFSHIMVNYDLPWNPMKVEQRIGRLDRIGQKKEVLIYNLAYEDTLEEQILDILDRRIGLFEESVGSLDPILGEVERDVERLVMEHAANLDRGFEIYGQDLEEKVKQARAKEVLLADFILDRASMRQDEAAELLGEDPLATWSDLRDFVDEALRYFGGRVSSHIEGGDSVALAPKLASRLGIKDPVTRGEFNPAVALQLEELDFLAFGHELIDRIVDHVAQHDVLTGARHVPDAPGGWSVEILYELESEGVHPTGRIIRHLVGPDLEVREENLSLMPELGSEMEPPVLAWVGDAVGASQSAIGVAQGEERALVRQINDANRAEELDRAERIYAYQRERLQSLIEEGMEWIERAEASGTEGQRKVLPARKGKLNRNRERLSNLKAEYQAKRDDLELREADVTLRVIAAGLVHGP